MIPDHSGDSCSTKNLKTIHVAAGIVLRGGQIFLTKRAADVHQGGKWEFPGGKVEAGESAEQALSRELNEEIGITVSGVQSYLTIEHQYVEKKVILDFYLVEHFSGEPGGCEGQQFNWFLLNELSGLDFPEANQVVVDKLLAGDSSS